MINDADWCKGTAYIVETRPHANLPIVLKNADNCLPHEWKIIVFCGPDNEDYVEQETSKLDHRAVRHIKLEKPIKSLKNYNDLLLSTWFWQQFDTENLLGFQVDSLFNEGQKEKLSELVEYDYVGAPWSEGIQRRWDYIPSFGGNGGVCFSKRSARLKALELATQPYITGEPHYQILNEDIWFSLAFHELGFRLPERHIATRLFVESVYSPQAFAVHKPWCYLAEADFQTLLEKMPLLETIKKGCEEKNESTEGDDYRRFLLRFARNCLHEENYYQADLALQVCQSRFPKDPVGYNLQSVLANKLSLFEAASRFVNKSLEINPNFIKAIENKKHIDRAYSQHKGECSSEERYLLIHSWGSGLGFDLLYLLKQLMVAELTNRKPMIYWGENSLYNSHPSSDCFTDYFEPISNITFEEIEPFHDSCYPGYWKERPLQKYVRRTRWRNKVNHQQFNISGLYYLNRKEKLTVAGEFSSVKMLLPWVPEGHRLHGMSVPDLYRDLMGKYISPRIFLHKRANSFVSEMFANKKFIAIHLRGTDKKQERQSNDIAKINEELIQNVAKLDASLPIFVMTDDVRQISAMKVRFGARVTSVDVTRSDGDELGVHHTASDKQKIAEEVIVDMLIAAQAEYFFGCGFSYLACCVAAFRAKQAHIELLPFNVLTRFSNIPTVGMFGIK